MIWKVKPLFRTKLWGSASLLTSLGFLNPKQEKVGEILLLSALPGEESIISTTNKKYSGKLSKIYKTYPNLFFQNSFKEFPLLLKILTPAKDLSIQVHPTDEYAQQNENQPFGKQESWVCLSANPKQKIILGHLLDNAAQMKSLVEQKKWSKIISYSHLAKNSLMDIPPGTVHAVLANTIVYELQQNSDLTYRLFDYDRLTSEGKLRPLHVTKALDNIWYPQKINAKCQISFLTNRLKLLLKNKHYLLYSLEINSTWTISTLDNGIIGTVIEGFCVINKFKFVKWETFILSRTTTVPFIFTGNTKMLIATINPIK